MPSSKSCDFKHINLVYSLDGTCIKMPTILDCFTLRQHTDQYSGPHYAMCPYSILRYATALPQSGPKLGMRHERCGESHCPKRNFRRWKVFFICGNFYFWKCFIYSNFLTVTVKMIVIETNIFLLIFLFWKRNIFLTVECRLPHPTFKICSLLFCSVLEIFRLWCGNLLSLVWHFFLLWWNFSPLVWKFFIGMRTKNFHTRDEIVPHQRLNISILEMKYFHSSLLRFA